MNEIEKSAFLSEHCPLFLEIDKADIPGLLSELRARSLRFGEGTVIFYQGEHAEEIGVVIEGRLEASSIDINGNEAKVASLVPGNIFADFLSADADAISPVTLAGRGPGEVLLINFKRLFDDSVSDSQSQKKLLSNLTVIYAKKYFEVKNRIICLTAPSVRAKISAFLSFCHAEKGSDTFNIGKDREALAAYLHTDRSALSRELSKMRKDGIIDYYKETFKIIDIEKINTGGRERE